jgi:hypothetical protein
MIATPKLKGKKLERLLDQIKDIKAIRDDLEAKTNSKS